MYILLLRLEIFGQVMTALAKCHRLSCSCSCILAVKTYVCPRVWHKDDFPVVDLRLQNPCVEFSICIFGMIFCRKETD